MKTLDDVVKSVVKGAMLPALFLGSLNCATPCSAQKQNWHQDGDGMRRTICNPITGRYEGAEYKTGEGHKFIMVNDYGFAIVRGEDMRDANGNGFIDLGDVDIIYDELGVNRENMDTYKKYGKEAIRQSPQQKETPHETTPY